MVSVSSSADHLRADAGASHVARLSDLPGRVVGMGKQSRRESRRNRPKRQRSRAGLRAIADEGLKLVVATSPEGVQDGGTHVLGHDLQMVRSALLYADHVELLSPLVPLVSSMAAVNDAGIDGFLAVYASLEDDQLAHMGLPDPGDFKESMMKYQQFLALPRAERRRLPEFQAMREQMLKEAAEHFGGKGGPQELLARKLEESGAPELVEALDSGLLTLNVDFMPEDGDQDKLMENYAAELGRMLTSADSHLLLDQYIASMAGAMIREGMVEPSELTMDRATRSRLGTGLASKLPAFPNATVASVLEARADLAEPLARYRGGVTQIARQLRFTAVDPELDGEIADMWRDEVQPAVRNIEQDLSRTRLVKEAGHVASGDIWGLGASGAIYFGMEKLTDIENWMTAGVTAASFLGRSLHSAIRAAEQRRQDARRHQWFYLLELDRRI